VLAVTDRATAEVLALRLYDQALADYASRSRVTGEVPFDGTLADLVRRFLQYARQTYICPATGQPTKEVVNLEGSLTMLLRTVEPGTRAEDFGPLAFKAYRDELVRTVKRLKDGRRLVIECEADFDPATMRRAFCRNYINSQCSRIKRLFSWASESELLSGSQCDAIKNVKILRLGRTLARETPAVKPVDESWVWATVEHARPMMATMIELQLLTGMRPGEVCSMRMKELDQSDPTCWLYRPTWHKTAIYGHERVVPLNERAQELIRPFLRPNPEAAIFSRAVNRVERYNTIRETRQSTASVTGTEPMIEQDYYRCVQAAIRQANRRRAAQAKKTGEKFVAIPAWFPNQIRHTVATALRQDKSLGLDSARAMLGHRTLGMTDTYGELDKALAVEAAKRRKIG
jgi:integrase